MPAATARRASHCTIGAHADLALGQSRVQSHPRYHVGSPFPDPRGLCVPDATGASEAAGHATPCASALLALPLVFAEEQHGCHQEEAVVSQVSLRLSRHSYTADC